MTIVFVSVFGLGSGLARAQDATLTDDARTNANRPNKNFGADDTVQVRGAIERGLLKFKLTPNLPPGTVGSHVGKATLKLFVGTLGAPGQVVVQRVTGSWNEQAVTDLTFPTLGVAEATVPVNAGTDGKWVTVDVTQLVKDWLDAVLPNNGVALISTGGLDAIFDSKENTNTSHEPRLEIVLNHAATADTATDATKLGGVDATQFVKATDPRLTDSRTPTAGSTNYVQNSTTPQAGANFNIGGNGTIAGTLTVGGAFSLNIVNAQTQYNLGGSRVLSSNGVNNLFMGKGTGASNTPGSPSYNSGNANTFVGALAGQSNTSGDSNAFFGAKAGTANTIGIANTFTGAGAGEANITGSANSFFGFIAGFRTTTGDFNSFLGHKAGSANLTGGSNVFVGEGAGGVNTIGNNNTFIGSGSGLSNGSGSNNSLVGYRTAVGADGLTNATAIGSTAVVAQSNSIVLGSIKNTNGASADTSVGIGTTTPAFRLTVNTGTDSYGIVHTDKDTGVVVGTWVGAGATGTPGGWLGTKSPHPLRFFTNDGAARLTIDTAGNVQIPGQLTVNTFDVMTQYNLGGNRFLSSPFGNLFVGIGTGQFNISGSGNSFFGSSAGQSNTTASNNTFAGASSGQSNTTGYSNAFFGTNSGLHNTIGIFNTFLGTAAGKNNTVADNNTFIGADAGFRNETGTDNTFVGTSAGFNNVMGSNNSFFGREAGLNNTASGNSFFGHSAGRANTAGLFNVFMGGLAGKANTVGMSNTFVGYNAGSANVSGQGNVLFGTTAGDQMVGSENTVVGYFAGASSPFGFVNDAGNNNTFIGSAARPSIMNLTNATAIGSNAVVATNDTIVLGKVAGIYNGVGRPADTVQVPGNLNINGNGTVGGTFSAGTLSVTGPASASSFNGNGAGLTNLNASNISTGTLSNARLGLIPTANIADSAVTALKIAPGQVVKNFNGLTDAVTLAAGSNITVTPSGNTLTIASTSSGLTLPYAANQSDAGTLFSLTNAGLGSAASFVVNNSATPSAALTVSTNGTGPAISAIGAIETNTLYNIAGNHALSTAGTNNLFIGARSSAAPGEGAGNTFVGAFAGLPTSGNNNTIVGSGAGQNNSIGGGNSFFGWNAGAATYKHNNSFFGIRAGEANTTGRDNAFFGAFVGPSNITGTGNTLIGARADLGAPGLTNATAIGANAVVSQDNSIVLGSLANEFGFVTDTRVGIGTTAPKAKLDISGGNILVGSPGQGIILKSPDGLTCRLLSIDNAGALVALPFPCP